MIFVTSMLQAQDAKDILTKSIQVINNLQNVSYHNEIQQTNPMNGDTDKIVADCYLRRMPKDTLIGMYYFFSSADSGFDKYNGTEYYSYSPEYYNFILRYSLKDNPEKFRSIKLSYGIVPSAVVSPSSYSYALLNFNKKLSSMLDYLLLGSINSKKLFMFNQDTVVDNVHCYGFKLMTMGNLTSSSKIILIDKNKLLPIALISDAKGASVVINNQNVSLSQYSSVRYSNIKDTIPEFDYLMSEKSIPKQIEILDHYPNNELFKKGDLAPSWKHPEINGNKTLSLDSLRGKIVVMDFTSTWCIHCVEGSIVIKNLYQKYNDRKDVIFINVFSYSNDTREKVQKYIALRNIEGITIYNATSSEKPYGIYGYPDFFIISRQGRITYFQRGYSNDLQEILSKEIDTCLGKE